MTATTVATLGLSLYVFYRARHRDMLDHVSLWMCTFFVAFRFVWEHHLVMLLPILAVELMRNRRSMIILVWVLLAIPTIFVLIDVELGGQYAEVQRYWTGGESLLYHSMKFVPLVWLYLLVIFRLLDKRLNSKAMLLSTLTIVAFAWTAYSLGPETSRDYMALALKAERAERFEEADSFFRESIRHERKYIDAYFYYTEFLLRAGRVREAERIRDEVREIAPDHPVFEAARERR
jgi:tetratricopeptide (TPR) repeat protein